MLTTSPTFERSAEGASRSAITLFTVCIAVCIAVAVATIGLTQSAEKKSEEQAKLEAARDMVGRVRAYRKVRPDFFHGIALSVFPHSHGAASGTLHRFAYSSDGKIYLSSLQMPGLPSYLVVTEGDYKEAELFGKEASSILGATTDEETRKRLLLNAVSNYIQCPTNRQMLEGDVGLLARIDQEDQWTSVARWVVLSTWPGMLMTPAYFRRTSYLTWGDIDPNEPTFPGRLGTLSAVADMTPAEAEGFLEKEMIATSKALEQPRQPPPTVAVPGLGVPLRLDLARILAGPSIVLLQVIYMLFWRQHLREVGSDEGNVRAFIFPTFNSPADPCARPCPGSLVELVERSIWSLFLLLPVGILATGVLTRYEFGTVLWGFGGDPRLTRLLVMRSADGISVGLDFIGLAWLAISIAVVTHLTASAGTRATKARADWTSWITLLLPLGLWIGVAVYRVGLYAWGAELWKPTFAILFGALWAGFLGASILHERWFVGVLSGLGYGACLFLLV